MFLNKWGTIAFETSFMKQMIGFGEPIFRESEFIGFDRLINQNNLNLSVWLSFVPDVYRHRVEGICYDQLKEFIGWNISEINLIEVICRIQQEIDRRIEPV